MGKDLESTMQWKVDISQLKAGMQEAKRSISQANAEFKKSTAGLDNWSKSTEGVRAKITQLKSVLQNQTTILAQLQKQYNIVGKELGKDSAEAQKLKTQITNQQAAINKTVASLKDYSSKLDTMEKEEKEANSATSKLTKTIDEQQKKVDDLKKAYKDSIVGRNPEEAKKLKTELSKASKELKESKDKMNAAEKAADKLDKSLDDVNASAGTSAKEGFTVLKGALANLVTDGIRRATDGFKQLIETGIEYESSFANVKKTVDGTDEQLGKLNTEIRNMAKEMPQSASDIAEVAAAAGQLGIEVDSISDFTKTMIMLGDSTNLSSEEAASALAKFANVTKMSADDYSRLGSVIVDLGNNFATTEADIVALGQNLASAGSQVGMSQSDIMALSTALSSVGMEAQAGGTAFSKLMIQMQLAAEKGGLSFQHIADATNKTVDEIERLAEEGDGTLKDLATRAGLTEAEFESLAKKGGGALNDFARIAGMSAEEFQKAFKEDAVSAIQAFIAGLGDTERNGESAIKILDDMGITETRLRDSILRAVQAKDVFNEAVQTGRSAWEADTALQNEAQQRYETTAAKIEILKNNIKDLGITLFEKLKPHIEKVIDAIKKLVNNESALKKLATAFGIVAGVLAGMFATVKIANFINGLKSIIATLTALKAKMAATAAGAAILNAALAAMPWILLAAGVAALVAGIVTFIKKADEAARATYALTDEQKKFVEEIAESKKAYDELNASRKEAMDGVATEYDHLSSLIREYNEHVDSNGKVKDSYKDRADFILNELAKAFGMEVDEIKKLIDENGKLGNSIKEVMDLKRAEALLNANQEAYSTAIQEQSKAWQDYRDALELVNEKQRDYNEAKAKLAAMPTGGFNERRALEGATEALDQAREAMHNAKDAWMGYNQTIQNYEGLGAAIQSKDANKIASAMATIRYNIASTETADRESLERQVKDLEEMLESMKRAAQEEGSGITDAMIEELELGVKLAKDNLATSYGIFKDGGEKNAKGYADGYKSGSRNNGKVGKDAANETNKGAASVNSQFSVTGKTASSKYSSGVLSGKSEAYRSAYQVALQGGEGYKATNPYPEGSQDSKDYAEGIAAGKEQAKQNASTVADYAEQGFKSGSAYDIGYNMTLGLARGMASGDAFSVVRESAIGITNFAISKMREAGLINSPSRATMIIGDYLSQGLAVGIKSGIKGVADASIEAADASIDAMADALGIHSPSTVARDKIGKNIAKGVVDGLNTYNSKTRQALQNNINSWWKKIDDLNRKKSQTSNKNTKKSLQKQIDDLKSKIKTAQKEINQLYTQYNSNLIDRAQSRISDLQKYDRITLAQEVTYWEKIVKSLKKGANGYSKAYSEATGELKLAKRAYRESLIQKDNDSVSALQNNISRLESLDKISLKREVELWQKKIKTLKKGSEAYKAAEVELYTARKNLAQQEVERQNTSVSNLQSYISRMNALDKMSAKKEVSLWEAKIKTLKKGTEAYKDAQVELYTARKALSEQQTEKESQSVSNLQSYISRMNSLDKMSAKREVELWEAKIKTLKKGTQAYKDAEVELYTARKNLTQQQADKESASVSNLQSYISRMNSLDKMSAKKEVELWEAKIKTLKKGTQAYKEAEVELYTARKALEQQETEKQNTSVSNLQSYISRMNSLDKMSAKKEVALWESKIKTLKKGTEAYKTAEVELYTARKALAQQEADKQTQSVSDLQSYISRMNSLDKMSAKTEVALWEKKIKTLKKGTQAYKDAEVELYQARKNLAQQEADKQSQSVSNLQSYISRMSSLDKMSAKTEVALWEKKIATLKKGTQAYKDAEVELYQARKALSEQEADKQSKSVSNLQNYISRMNSLDKMTAKTEVALWEKKIKILKKGTDAYKEAEVALYQARKALSEQQTEQQNQSVSNLQSYISRMNTLDKMTVKQEVVLWEKKIATLKKGSQAYQDAEVELYQARKALREQEAEQQSQSVSDLQSYISRMNSLDKMSAKKEVELWEAKIKTLKKGTQAYKDAEVELYQARKALSEQEADAQEKIVSDLQSYISRMNSLDKMSAKREVELWEAKIKTLKKGSQAYLDAEVELYQARKNLAQQASDAESQSISELQSYISRMNSLDQMTVEKEVELWEAKIKTLKKGTQAYLDAEVELYQARKSLNQKASDAESQGISDLQSYIARLNSLDQMSLKTEVELWEKKIAALKEGTQAYKDAEVELYQARKALNESIVSDAQSRISYLKSLDKMSAAEELKYWDEIIKSVQKGTDAYQTAEVELYSAKKGISSSAQSLTADFTSSVAQLKSELSDSIKEIKSNLSESIVSLKDTLQSDIASVMQTYTDALSSRTSDLTNAWGGLFNSINLSPKVTAGRLLENLQLQVDALNAYDKTLASLEEKLGTNSALVAELREQGVDSLHTMQSLDEMSAQELANYVALYEQRTQIATKRATVENETLKREVNAEIAELKKSTDADIVALQKEADAQIKELQDNAAQEIKTLTQTFKDGLIELGVNVAASSKTVGNAITSGIAAGIEDGMKDVTGALKKEVQGLVDTVKVELKIKSPSRVFRDEIGKMLPPGIADGFTIAMPKAESEMQEALRGAVEDLKQTVEGSANNIIPFTQQGYGGISDVTNQVVNFNQTINSPKAVDRLTLYRQTNSLLFNAKVRLGNV